MRTEDAVTQASGVWVSLAAVFVLYTALGIATVLVLRAMARRWRAADGEPTCPTDRARRDGRARRRDVSTADAVAAVLWVGVTLYAVFGGADFGCGLWALLAGRGRARQARCAHCIDWAIGPVWEANHVWLIFVLVTLWTGFPEAFAVDHVDAVHPALPRGPRDRPARAPASRSTGWPTARLGRRLAEAAFAVASVLTPFFMGTVVGADRLRPRAGRQRRGRPGDELAQPDVAR